MDACGWESGGDGKKLEPTDVILSSSHAKKLVFLHKQNFDFGRDKKSVKFFFNIN